MQNLLRLPPSPLFAYTAHQMLFKVWEMAMNFKAYVRMQRPLSFSAAIHIKSKVLLRKVLSIGNLTL